MAKIAKISEVMILFALTMTIAFAAQPKQSANSPTSGMMQIPMVAPLFIQGHRFTSTLVLVNAATIPEDVDVSVRSLNGSLVASRRISLAPHDQQDVDVADLVKSSGPADVTGSIIVMPAANSGSAVAAALSMTYRTNSESNYIDEELAMPNAEGSQTLRAVADSGSGSPYLAISSLSESVQHVKVVCVSRKRVFSKLVEIGPAQTLVTACDSRSGHDYDLSAGGFLDGSHVPSAEPFGIALTSDGMPGSFAAFGLELHEHASQRFFSSVSFVDPKMVMSSTGVFVGVPVGRSSFLNQQSYVPQVTLANFGSNEVQATVQYAQSSNDTVNFRDLMSVSIPAMSSKEVTFSGLEGNPDLKNSFLVTSNAAPGDLVSKLLAKGNSQPREVELLARDAMAPENGGNHPWSLVGSTQSFLLLFNNDQRVQTFSVTIGGANALWRKTYTLQPMQTKLIDVGAVRRNKTRDDHGTVLPSDLASGEVYWFNSAGSGRGRVLEANSAIGLARNFSCFVFAAPCTPASVSLSPSTVGVGGQSSAQVNYQICAAPDQFTCAGPPSTGSPDFSANWTSQNTSIASAAGSNQFATVTGLGAGSTGIMVEVSNEFGNCKIPATANVTVQKSPDHLVVQHDTTSVVCSTNGTVRRDITYSEVDLNGNNVGTISTKEKFASKSANTCNTTINTSETCSPDSSGILTDHLWVGCNSVGGSCGITYTKQQWLYCPAGSGTPVVFATPGDLVVHNNSVTVSGHSSFSTGTKIFADGTITP